MNTNRLPHVVILGAGPAGLAAAYRLASTERADVTVVERNGFVGGNAGSFSVEGINVDYGSHRLHPTCAPEILSDIRSMLGPDLLDRPRHGRIRLHGRWIRFPLQAMNLLMSASPRFLMGAGFDVIKRQLKRDSQTEESFASVLKEGLGPTICNDFYFPYARKIWGCDPSQLSATQARRRVQAQSLAGIARKIFSKFPGMASTKNRFYYPRNGFGQISDAYFHEAKQCGATFHLSSRIESIHCNAGRVDTVVISNGESQHTLAADQVWSTIPVTTLTNLLQPAAPAHVTDASRQIRFRGMVLVYLTIGQRHLSEFDAHYFPEEFVPMTRLSEPKNYSECSQPEGRTVLCAEVPCDPHEKYWNMSDADLGNTIIEAMGDVGLPVEGQLMGVQTRRLSHAYPIYDRGYETALHVMQAWLSQIRNLLTFGRQGLFAHDNTHHTMAMAYAAVECMKEDGELDWSQWNRYEQIFQKHVVED